MQSEIEENLKKSAFATSTDGYTHRGLSKREYAAIHFMKSLISGEADPVMAALLQHASLNIDLSNPVWIAVARAKVALVYVDALFEELERC